jgi:hypothetical protein
MDGEVRCGRADDLRRVPVLLVIPVLVRSMEVDAISDLKARQPLGSLVDIQGVGSHSALVEQMQQRR